MTDQARDMVDSPEKERHEEVGTTIHVYLPPECPFELFEQIMDSINEVVLEVAEDGTPPWDQLALVTATRASE